LADVEDGEAEGEGVSRGQALSGAHLVVPADRILEPDESDAKPLLAAGWMRA
jgi:hypothetical protein